MKRNLLLLLSLLLWVGVSYAQTKVTGKVTSAEDGTPVLVTVAVKGTTTGVYTDTEGMYSINVPNNQSVLVFSGIGYKTVEVQVGTRTVINVQIASDAVNLDEVVLTAYGPQSKKAFTGTASIVKADDLKNLKVSSVSKALQGMASGVLVVNSNGQPGENATIRIRGVGSLSGSSDPLIVLDGVIYNGNLNTINPNDIESFTVLKDANSTALFGSRAANGVIMITTKMGRPGKTKVTATASYGISQRAVKDYEYLNNQEYMELLWERMYMDNVRTGLVSDAEARTLATTQLTSATVYNPFSVDNPVGTDGKLVSGAKLLYEEDWNKALFQVGKRQEYNLQATGGNEKNRFMLSGGYLDDDGLVKMSNFKRYSVRGKIDAAVGDWFKVGLNMGLSYSKQNYPTQGGSSIRNSVLFVRSVASIYPAYERNRDGSMRYNANGELIPDYGRNTVWGADRPVFGGSNPLGTFTYDDISYNRFMSNNSAYAEAKFLKDFTFQSKLGVDHYILSGKEYYNNIIGDGTAYGGRSERERTTTSTISWTNTLTYDKTFMDEHHVNVLLGTESYDYQTDYLGAEKRGFDFADQELDYGANLIKASSNRTATRNFRYLARVNYDFSNRYHISSSYTYDGTSRFYRDARWGSFWSVGAGWNIANESFMANVNHIINTLKLRASYGTSGNQNLGLFPYLATYNTGWNILGSLGSIVGKLANNNLTWEKQNQLDVGVDFALLGNRLSGSFTYFDRRSEDLLMERPLPLSAGITSYNDNIGEVRNNGLEVDIKGVLLQSRDFYWDLGLNLTIQKNRVTALPEEQKDGFDSPYSTSKRIQVGESIYSWYLREFAGIDPEDGKPTWYKDVTDTEGNVTGRETTKTYSDGTRYIVGDALPKALGGINTNFSWKGISLGIITSFAIGNKILDTDKSGLMSLFSADRTGYQASKDVLNRWQKPGDITNVSYLSGASMNYNSSSTLWLKKGDYLRVRSINISYDLATLKAVKNLGLSSLRLTLSADNPFTIFGEEGLDPEQGLGGITSNTSSSLKVFSFGLNLEF